MLEGMQAPRSGVPGYQGEEEHPFDSSRDTLFATKCLCLISSHPIVKPLQAYLEQLYAITAGGKEAQLPVESYLFNLLYKIPMPRPGHKIVITGPLGKITWRSPSLADLPLCDYSFSEFFELLGVKNILRLLACLLLEHQVLLKSAGDVCTRGVCVCVCDVCGVCVCVCVYCYRPCVSVWACVLCVCLMSADYQRLMLCAFCSISLLFPFNWHHVFVPILPAAQVGFLDAPVPFLMGLHVDPLAPSRSSLLQLEVVSPTSSLPQSPCFSLCISDK